MGDYNKIMYETIYEYMKSIRSHLLQKDEVKKDLQSIELIIKRWLEYLGEEELKGYYVNNPYNNYNTLQSFKNNRSLSLNNSISREIISSDKKNELNNVSNEHNITVEINPTKEEGKEKDRKISLTIAIKIADYFKISLDELVGRKQ